MSDIDLEKWLSAEEYNTWNSGKQKKDMETIAHLRKRIKELEEGIDILRFYADENNWHMKPSITGNKPSAINRDSGRLAQNFLDSLEENNDE